MKSSKKMSGPILIALFAALVSVGSFIHIPMPGGVPVVIQDMLARLSGLLLGPIYGGLAVLLFLILGILGFPVFSGKAGIQVILSGPTGGFLIGYFVASILGGLIIKFFYPTILTSDDDSTKKRKNIVQWIIVTIASLSGTLCVFAFGIPGFMMVTGNDLVTSLPYVLTPFIPGTIVKTLLAVVLAKKFIPVIKNYL